LPQKNLLNQTFEFKKYISNGWYFLLVPSVTGEFASMVYNENQNTNLAFKADLNFESRTAQLYDLGYKSWNSGVLNYSDKKSIESLDSKVSLADEYRFIRKYYKPFWRYYILIIRVLGLHNPIKECTSFYKSRNMKFQGNFKHVEISEDYLQYNSKLITNKPKITVIIPTLNRYKYLKDAIEDLEKQSIAIHELIIIDQSDKVEEDFYKQFQISIKLIVQKERGQWLARNEAIRQSTGDWLLFFDDDSRVEKNWVEEHLKAVDYFKADISAGVSISKIGEKIPENYSFFRWADQFDSGNALVHKRVFEKIGLFDRQYDKMRMGDGEFGLRAYLNGFKSISHPLAKRLHLKVSEGGLRQVGSWDAFRTKKLLAPMPIPSVSYYYLTYFNKKALNRLFFQSILTSAIPYKYKGKKLFMPIFLFMSIIKLPISLYQFSLSKAKAEKRLEEGPILERLKK
jgi:glycosyltransferase involved in cell wall biosynthesis